MRLNVFWLLIRKNPGGIFNFFGHSQYLNIDFEAIIVYYG
jgi:hypothetical protein